jgi:uncharacterized repeat protein (TIGR03803 family)
MTKILAAFAFIAMVELLHAAPASAQKLTTLTTFNGIDGKAPYGTLLADGAGNLYGTTAYGGTAGDGTVFELIAPKAGQKAWTETVLFSFSGTNGNNPFGTLVADSAGNLYGTTYAGGPSSACQAGCGIVFALSPPAPGQTAWTETVIYSFDGPSGAASQGGLVLDKAGNLFGTTGFGGAIGDGAIFELTPPKKKGQAWTETVLASFSDQGGGPAYPSGTLLIDKAGNLYGTGGAGTGYGTVFELSPPAKGQSSWPVTVLHAFSFTDGSGPGRNLIFDSAGNLYGVTIWGGASTACDASDGGRHCGTVFELSPPAAGQTGWTETVLFSFDAADGALPEGGVIMGSAGNLYGTTYVGGSYTKCSAKPACGTVFELSPPASGQTAWTERVLASFDGRDGDGPYGSLIADKAGNLFGTSTGAAGRKKSFALDGTVFEVTP